MGTLRGAQMYGNTREIFNIVIVITSQSTVAFVLFVKNYDRLR